MNKQQVSMSSHYSVFSRPRFVWWAVVLCLVTVVECNEKSEKTQYNGRVLHESDVEEEIVALAGSEKRTNINSNNVNKDKSVNTAPVGAGGELTSWWRDSHGESTDTSQINTELHIASCIRYCNSSNKTK